MYASAFNVRKRLQNKFVGTDFSVWTDVKGFLRITWSNGPSLVEVSVFIRDFKEEKFYVRTVGESQYKYHEKVLTNEELRKFD